MIKYTLLFRKKLQNKQVTIMEDVIEELGGDDVFLVDEGLRYLVLLANPETTTLSAVLKECLRRSSLDITKDFPGTTRDEGHYIVIGERQNSQLTQHGQAMAAKLF